jgi:predicted transposase/invertase (TIGR01784 family)
MTFADPKRDIAFKKVFGNENKTEILICFLNAVLDLHDEHAIMEITILNPYQAPKISILKESNLDVRAKTQGGVTFIVEMQVEKQDYFAKRALYYTAKAYVAQIEKAEQYPKLNQVIFIGILDFTLFETTDYLSTHLILDKKTHTQEITDLELNFIELPKFTLQLEELTTIIEKWVYFFKHAGDLTVIPDALSDPHELVEAFELLEQHTWTKDELDIYDYWAMKEAGHQDALETAKRDGRKDVAKRMLHDNVPLDTIVKWTGLSREEIEKLQKEAERTI